MSLMALYQADDDLFENLHLPTGADQTTIINNLLYETIDMDTIYTDPTFMKTYIGIWSTKKMEEWQLIYDALLQEYNPIENYDRTEDITETRNLADDHTTTRNLEDDHTETRDLNGSTDTELKTAAYDASTYQSKEKSETDTTDEGTVRYAGSDTGTLRNAGTDTGTVRRAGRIHGNIGVTTSTALLKEYIDYRANICFDEVVVNDFIKQFIRMVY